ncbi:MAG: Gfo/Idh/MocA family oxidoreductase [Bryobacterales bacterium]|nr:Gfo/Idh/MocA family oxidoreductase [Bryobacterales bacterium]
MDNTSSLATRRGFLGTVTAATAASYSRILGANDRVGIGLIGFGLIGKQHLNGFRIYKDVEVLGVCDTYKPRIQEGVAYAQSPNCKGYQDFRKMYEDKNIHGVVVATPDHWHALLSILACQAGKDVYVEKPLTVANDEGKWMIMARDKYKRVVVVGTQRNHNPGHQVAKKIYQSGVLGKVQMVKMGGSGRNIYPGFGKTPVENPPADLDYEMWLGPAPKKPYQNHRALYHFRWFWDYSGGQLTNLGAHSISAFLLVTGVKGPVKVSSFGGRFVLEDDGETPDRQEVLYEFPEFTLTTGIREANAFRDSTGSVIMGTKGNLVLGSNTVVTEVHGNPLNQVPRFLGHPIGGVVYDQTPNVPWIEGAPTSLPAGGARGGARGGEGAAGGPAGRGAPGAAKPASRAPAEFSGEETMYLNHRDFIDCIRTRNKPLCDLEMGHRTAIICNLGNMSLRLGGRMIRWDPDKEIVIGDKEAAAMCTPHYRAPWDKALKSAVGV